MKGLKIALLNLPFDNNYGGNLQRYALMKVLQGMGHDVTHINLRCSSSVSNFKLIARITKRIFLRLIGKNVDLFYEKHIRIERQRNEKYANEFYGKYIKHTEVLYTATAVKSINWLSFDIALVGSDQVWRYDMTNSIGLENFFFRFLDDEFPKIAYSVSLGKYDSSDINLYKKFYSDYRRFTAVSFREQQGIQYAQKVGWDTPSPEFTLDPTLLLTPNMYIEALNLKKQVSDFVFCYVLDKDEGKLKQMESLLSNQYSSAPIVKCGLKSENCIPIEQWLENILNSSCVITDSYHGVVFSILFNKKYYFLGNNRRGNDRLDSLLSTLFLDVDEVNNTPNWTFVNNELERLRNKSLHFLTAAINTSKVMRNRM